MHKERKRITTLEELNELDDREIFKGYFEYDPDFHPPGDNCSDSYYHGWMNAHRDKTGTSDAISKDLARQVRESGALLKPSLDAVRDLMNTEIQFGPRKNN